MPLYPCCQGNRSFFVQRYFFRVVWYWCQSKNKFKALFLLLSTILLLLLLLPQFKIFYAHFSKNLQHVASFFRDVWYKDTWRGSRRVSLLKIDGLQLASFTKVQCFKLICIQLKFIFYKKGAKKSQLHEICRILSRANSNKLH